MIYCKHVNIIFVAFVIDVLAISMYIHTTERIFAHSLTIAYSVKHRDHTLVDVDWVDNNKYPQSLEGLPCKEVGL